MFGLLQYRPEGRNGRFDRKIGDRKMKAAPLPGPLPTRSSRGEGEGRRGKFPRVLRACLGYCSAETQSGKPQKDVAQVSQPAVSPISNRQGVGNDLRARNSDASQAGSTAIQQVGKPALRRQAGRRKSSQLASSNLQRNPKYQFPKAVSNNSQMKPDNFEKKLERLPLREIPRDWRNDILSAARRAIHAQPAPRSTLHGSRSLLSTLNRQLSTLLWPAPRAWAGLAAIWLGLLIV